mgnify:CR=1 FL=1
MNEEGIYELISEEIDNGNTKDGLWTKAFSKSEGDKNKTKALYIKYRFDQIKQEQPEVDQETNVRDDEKIDKSGNKNNCYYSTKSQANLRIIFKC